MIPGKLLFYHLITPSVQNCNPTHLICIFFLNLMYTVYIVLYGVQTGAKYKIRKIMDLSVEVILPS